MGLLNELEEIKRKEKGSKKSLQKLKKNFYEEIMNKIEDLRIDARVYVEKMDIDKAGKIMDEIKKIEKALDEIIALRVRKILLFTIWKKEKDIKNLTKEEEILYRDVKNAINRHKDYIYKREITSPFQEKIEKEEIIKKEEQKKDIFILARVKVPNIKIALPDKNLLLKKEDVLHLPKKIYDILIKDNIVEKIEIK